MAERIVEVAHPALLKRESCHLVVFQEDGEAGRVPFEELGMLLLDGPGITLTHEVVRSLMVEGGAFVVSDERHLPCGLMLPIDGHSLHAKTLREQVASSEPKRKQVWRQIVQAKLASQADVLDWRGGPEARRAARTIREMIPDVRSGDTSNREAVAAMLYFPALFGDGFVRERDELGVNAMLNYGYAVVRAAVARSLVGAGLHCALGVHHDNQYNGFNLADDAVEPLRPLVDQHVMTLVLRGEAEDQLTPALKRSLLRILTTTVVFDGRPHPILSAMPLYAASIRRAICEEARKVQVPVWNPIKRSRNDLRRISSNVGDGDV